MTLFSEKVLISNRCISGLMSNLIKISLTDPYLEWLELSLWDVQVVVLYGLVFSELVGGMDLANKIFVWSWVLWTTLLSLNHCDWQTSLLQNFVLHTLRDEKYVWDDYRWWRKLNQDIYLGRNQLPKPFLILPSLNELKTFFPISRLYIPTV